MATMNVSLPRQMKEWVEERAADGHAMPTRRDYVRDLDPRRSGAAARRSLNCSAVIEEGLG